MDFHILGPLQVWAEGRQIAIPAAKHRTILAILLLQANRVVSSQRLVQLLWGEDAPETAANTLQVHVSQLRNALEPGHRSGSPYDVVVTQPPGYLLQLGPDELDLSRFKALVDNARVAKSHGEWQSAAKLLRSGLELWRGLPFADLSEEGFVLAERGRLEELRLQALEDRVEADMILGAHTDLISELEITVEEHPFRERFTGHLMLCLYRSGRQAEATEVFYRASKKLVDEFGIEPGPALQDLSRRILSHDPGLVAPTLHRPSIEPQKVRLPAPLTRIIGREKALEQVKAFVSQSRLVTLVGAGGIGKSRLALEVAHETVPAFPDGLWFVELAGVRDQTLVEVALRAGIGIADQTAGSDIDAVANFLGDRRVLVVVDNCEHVIGTAAHVIAYLLQECVNLRVLATSRELLRVPGERVFDVSPLDIPDRSPSESVRDVSSVQLFCERAASSIADFSPDDGELRLIAETCRRLDGLPLAIELAAARMRLLSIHEIAARLDDRLALLKVGARVGPAHHQTLRACLDWSYSMLAPAEQLLLRRFAVFIGKASLRVLESVCGGDGIDQSQVSDLLGSLADKSLLSVDRTTTEPSYRLSESIRAYALELADAAEELGQMRSRHLKFHDVLAGQLHAGLRSGSQAGWLVRAEDSRDDFRAALEWARDEDNEALARICCGLAHFWLRWGPVHEGRRWFGTALSNWIPKDSLRGQCLSWAGIFAIYQADYEEARRLLLEGLAIHKEAGDRASEGWTLGKLGIVSVHEDNPTGGLAQISEGADILRAAGSAWNLSSALSNLGLTEFELGLPSLTCVAHLDEALEVARGTGDTLLQAIVALGVAQVAISRGDVSRARVLWRDALEVSIRLHETLIPTYSLGGFARLALRESRPELALTLFAAAQAALTQTGVRRSADDDFEIDRYISDARSALGEPAASQTWAAGLQLPVDQAIILALEPLPEVSATAPLGA
jgi:predicted ATPase/DNA-binding SARP family transcriptional activator